MNKLTTIAVTLLISLTVAPRAHSTHPVNEEGQGDGTKIVTHDATAEKTRNISLGVYYPFVGALAEQDLDGHFSYGVLAMGIRYSRAATSLLGVGFLGTLAYYDERFSGWWLRAGAGFHILNFRDLGAADDTRQSLTSLLLCAWAGWRWELFSAWTLALGAGGHYFPDGLLRNRLSFSGVIPSAVIEVGFPH